MFYLKHAHKATVAYLYVNGVSRLLYPYIFVGAVINIVKNILDGDSYR